MSELKKKSKTAFEVWQSTVLEAYKNLPKAPNMREYSNEISRIRKRKEWVKFVDAQVPEKKLEELKHKLQQLSNEIREKADFEFEHTQIDRESGYFISNPQQDFNSFLSWITKKFEELLKKDENHEGKRMQIRT